MKKIYSLVLMAAVLLIGTNAWAEVHPVSNASEFETAWKAAASGDVIKLTDNFSLNKMVWLGTANLGDAARSLEIDLNGKTLSSAKDYAFMLTHGKLKISDNSVNKGGQIVCTSANNAFYITGSTNKDVDPSKDSDKLTAGKDYFTYLEIAEGASVILNKYNAAISIDGIWRNSAAYNAYAESACMPAKPALTYITNVYAGKNSTYTTDAKAETNSNKCVANGVRIDVKGYVFGEKYGIKANGLIGNTEYYFQTRPQPGNVVAFSSSLLPEGYTIAEGDDQYSPYIYVYNTGFVKSSDGIQNGKAAVAIYASGYARWKVQGTAEGCNGAVVKSGAVDFNGATVHGTGTYSPASQDMASGTDAMGSGIVIVSSTAYAGDMEVTISGNSNVSSDHGYALDEAVVAADSKVEQISITGGVLVGGDQGTIQITEATTAKDPQATTVSVSGGTIVANENGVSIGGMDLEEFLSEQPGNTHSTIVDDENGNKTVVISDGAAPIAANSVIAKTDGQSCNWISIADTQETLEKNLTLTELQISSADYNQTLIIKEGYKLEVGRVVLGAKAQIVVKPGASLIVTGEQGIAAYRESNLVLETSQDAQPTFLIHPSVKSNTHPDATVQFISKGHKFADNSLAWQRFGIPSFGELSEVSATNQTVVAAFDYQNNAWVNIGLVGSTLDYSKMAEPFAYYQMTSNVLEMGTVVTMKGELYGNESPALSIMGNAWNGFANSYMAPINGHELLGMIPSTVQKAFYLNKIVDDQATWQSVTELNALAGIMEDIKPMQPFLIKNSLAGANASVNYEAAVYNPAMGIPSNAPARRAMADLTAAQLIVKGANGVDQILVAEGAEFTAEFDNGYDAVKYMNDGINMYVSANEKMSNFATDNLANTYVGFQTVDGGNYAIEFANVQGNDLTLIDHETNARIAMVNGSVYEFTAAANSVNDYRFEIVSRDNAPTAIENTEAVKSAKGIYTLTGQYVGEMNVWNTLPAGVYVVNGEKLVK